MSIDKLTKIAASLATAIDNNEQLLTSVLVHKLEKAAEAYPYDPTIVGMTRVINKFADKNMFVTRGQLRDLYNKFYSRNTKFGELFVEELGEATQLKTPKFANRIANEEVAVSTAHLGDQVLANALESVFDKNVPLKLYAKDVAESAKHIVATTLDGWNLAPTNVDCEAGNDKFIIVRANYETPKGRTYFYVPVQIVKNKATSPIGFIGNGTSSDLNHKNVKEYITKSAGMKLKISAENVLDVLTKAASEDREVSDAELALIRLNASRKEAEYVAGNQILAQKVESEVKEIQLPKYSEYSHLEEKFTSPTGIASFTVGEDKVNIGREIIARNLSSFGIKNAQITVADSNNNTVFYAVSLNSGRVAFRVPVKVENGKVQPPNVMLCQGSVSSFDANGVRKLFAEETTDYKAAAVASPNYNLKSSDLIENVRQAMKDQNLAKAEDALNVLAERGDAQAYATGFKVYASALTGKTDENDVTKHPLYNPKDFYTTSASNNLISKQTGLPISKIYIDENGNHRPLYRRGMNENYQGGFFMNYKIFG